LQVSVVDLYTDEPAGLGVPPYVGTSQRYVFGALRCAGHDPIWLTIDDLRKSWGLSHERLNLTVNAPEAADVVSRSDAVVVIGGVHTPGKYLRGEPGTPRDVRRICGEATGKVIVGGPITQSTMGGGRMFSSGPEELGEPDLIAKGDPELFVYRLFTSNTPPNRTIFRDYAELQDLAMAGTEVLRQMHLGPDVVFEIETSRGCSRAPFGGCSFCSECARYGLPEFREIADIVDEVRRLVSLGATNIRLGRQACFFSYMAEGVGELEFPVPNPAVVKSLLRSCSRFGLNSLHIDNVNPGVVSSHPEESAKVAESIVRYCTPGNVAAMGIESADPAVISRNNLKVGPEESYTAIETIYRYGSQVGWNGQPCLLPGLNFVLGLPGETARTYELNMKFLHRLLDDGIEFRRVNIRRVIPVRGTPLWGARWSDKAVRRRGKRFVSEVRRGIDRHMLQRVFPLGRILRSLVSEKAEGGITFFRFPGSYPIVVGVSGHLEPRVTLDAFVVDHGYRSLTAVRYPLDLNRCSAQDLCLFPGIGRKRAARISRARPIGSLDDLRNALDEGGARESEVSLLARAGQLA